MFPVKGLSVSAEKLKVETGSLGAPAAAAPKPSRKRKRQGNTETVTAANLADLWQKVIEHKGPSGAAGKTKPSKDGNKRQKQDHEAAAHSGNKGQQQRPDGEPTKKRDKKKDKGTAKQAQSLAESAVVEEQDGDEWSGIDDGEQPSQPTEHAAGKADKKKHKKPLQQEQEQAAGKAKQDTSHQPSKNRKDKPETAPPPASSAPAPAKLTALQASMRDKLISARFRHLNETLYTRPSAEAFQLFQDSPEMFSEYHEGFRRQVDVWPENPVDGYIADIKARAKVRFPPRNRHQPVTAAQLPLPKPPYAKTCTIADLGCGDAKLAAALQPVKAKLHLDIRSFDLQTGGSPLITRADIANLPLPDGSVDVAIFCLALMGTNWTDFVEEAYRVLRWRGELWVAEIKSRFANPAASSSKKKGGAGAGTGVVAHSVGHRRKGPAAAAAAGDKKGKPSRQDAEAAEQADLAELAVQVDGASKQAPQETDISAFVETLRKRGFLLNRDLDAGAVDMSNKMFVRMHFVKAAPAVKGKCAAPAPEEEKGHHGGQGQQGFAGRAKGRGGPGMQKKKFLGGDEDEDGVNEAAVLKPCVYKIR